MSKKVAFTVELEFSDKVTSDNDIQEVAMNVASALIAQSNNEGLAPDESDAFTTGITVKNYVYNVNNGWSLKTNGWEENK